jgi:hypothetical protein
MEDFKKSNDLIREEELLNEEIKALLSIIEENQKSKEVLKKLAGDALNKKIYDR